MDGFAFVISSYSGNKAQLTRTYVDEIGWEEQEAHNAIFRSKIRFRDLFLLTFDTFIFIQLQIFKYQFGFDQFYKILLNSV